MARADDLQRLKDIQSGSQWFDPAFWPLIDAIPDLLAVVRAADALRLWEPGRKGYAAAASLLFAALAAFEEGG